MLSRLPFAALPLEWLRRLALLLTIAIGTTVTGAQAHGVIDPAGFGVNIDSALLNPLEPGVTDVRLRQQIAAILYDARRIGARNVRWIVNDVWPQYKCGRDPEDQQTGKIDPGWRKIAATLLEEADKQGLRVVVAMLNFAGPNFNGLPQDQSERSRRFDALASHRAKSAGRDGYTGDHSCAPNLAHGYYGALRARDIFEQPELRARLLRRFTAMATFLEPFPALGAIELFNEPPFDLTQEPLYAEVVRALKKGIRAASPALADMAILSGAAFWERQVIAIAQQDGEPFVTAHSYIDYRDPAAAEQKLSGLLRFLESIAPPRMPIIVAEAGSNNSLTREQNIDMTRILLSTAASSKIGIWVWGDYIPNRGGAIDYKWVFNARSLAGGAFRPFFIDAAAEKRFLSGQRVNVRDAGANSDRQEPMSIAQVPEAEASASRRLKWRVSIGDERYLSFTRDGVLTRSPAGSTFSSPAPTLLVAEDPKSFRWARVSQATGGWRMEMYQCIQRGSESRGDLHTPDNLIGLATQDGWGVFGTCLMSRLVRSVYIES